MQKIEFPRSHPQRTKMRYRTRKPRTSTGHISAVTVRYVEPMTLDNETLSNQRRRTLYSR